PAQAPLPLRDQARGERAGPIPRDLQLDGPELGLHRLRRAPVAGVGVLRRLAGALLVAQVAGQLGLQASLERCLDQGGYEPAVTGQLDLASVDLLEQGIQLSGGLQLLDQVLARGPVVMLLLLVRHGHDCSVPLGTAYTDHLTRPTDDYRESRFHDAVLPWSIIAGRSHDTRCRHPRYKETSAVLGRVPISGQRVSLDRAATPPPGPLKAGQQSHTRPSDQTPSIGVLTR